MKTLVTGGAGFIGSHLCRRLLKEGHQVICVDNLLTGSEQNIEDLKSQPGFLFVNHDITKPLPGSLTAEAVFHLASPASPNHHSPLSYHSLPVETMAANTMGTWQLLEFAEKNKAKFLFASTSEVYGDPEVHPQPESYRGNVSTTGPRSVYDEAKRFGETIVSYFIRSRGVDARIARIFNTYGPNMQKEDRRMIIEFIVNALAGRPIPVFGDGSQTRSLCFVSDMVEGLFRLMFYPNTKGEIVNLGNGEEHTVLQFAQLVKKLTGSSSEIVMSEALPEDDPKKRKADTSKAKQLLQWSASVPLETGLQQIITYFRS